MALRWPCIWFSVDSLAEVASEFEGARLLHEQVVPYLQAAADNVDVAIDRAERLAAVLPDAWSKSGPLREAQPLLNVLHSLARHLESQRDNSRITQPAKRLSQVLSKLGDQARAGRLSAAFKL